MGFSPAGRGLLLLKALPTVTARWVKRVRARVRRRGGRRGWSWEEGSGPAQPSVLIPPPTPPESAAQRGWPKDRFPVARQVVPFAMLLILLLGVLYMAAGSEEPASVVYLQPSMVTPVQAVEVAEPAAAQGPTAVDPATGERLVVWAGDGQLGTAGRPLRQSLAVVVRDVEGRPIADREVRFEVREGGGALSTTSARTSVSGLALTSWSLGAKTGEQAVVASLPDRPTLTARFSARLAASLPGADVSLAATGGTPGERARGDRGTELVTGMATASPAPEAATPADGKVGH